MSDQTECSEIYPSLDFESASLLLMGDRVRLMLYAEYFGLSVEVKLEDMTLTEGGSEEAIANLINFEYEKIKGR